MGLSVDTELANLLVTEGTEEGGGGTGAVAITPESAYSIIVDDTQKLKKMGMHMGEMWLLVSNEFYGMLLKSPDFLTAKEVTVIDGSVGMIAALPVYETNNLPDGVAYVIGNNIFCHYVDEWKVPVSVKDLADGDHIGASALQGRQVYGYKISRPETVIVRKGVTPISAREAEPVSRRRRGE